jgi:aminopeptidase N
MIKMTGIKLFLVFIAITQFLNAQISTIKFKSHNEDTLNKISPLHDWWNLLYYTIEITPDYTTKSIVGTNKILFKTLRTNNTMQIDLQEPMKVISIKWNKSLLDFKKDKNKYIVTFPRQIKKGETQSITIHFKGTPPVAIKPPFDNGWIWQTDKKGRPWMSVACQGAGASIWLPCKEVYYDEPDNGISFSITLPDTLVAIANGRLAKKTNKNEQATYTWKVVSPINNYIIIPYIGKYVTWHENYKGLKGNLDCDFWVLDYDLDKAKKHFKQVDTVLQAFEYWFGPYPFYKDSYKLIDAPMLGMEHQSALAYGNGYQNGYIRDRSGKGWGLKWDFIIVHESGHEWFGNSITSSNHNDTWIHEGFAKYGECLYTSFAFGKEAGDEYALSIRNKIKNDAPIIGSGSTDQYYKGSAMLHTIRQIIGDSVFRQWLIKLNKTFYQKTVNTEKILNVLNDNTKKNFTKIFEQYLTTTSIPSLEYAFKNNSLEYRWINCVNNFDMPVKITLDNKNYSFIYPTTSWQKLVINTLHENSLAIDNNFYVTTKELIP